MTDTEIIASTYDFSQAPMLNTKIGLDVLAEGLKGERIIFTKVAIGDGILNVADDAGYRAKILEMDEMINRRMDLPIVEIINNGNGTVKIHAIKPNIQVPDSFFAREQAIFCTDPRNGKEILYSYRNSGDFSDFIPSNTGPVKKIIDISVTTIIQNAKKIDALLDASFAYVSINDFKNHVNSEHPHINTPNHYLDVADTNHFWAVDNDNHLHQISVDNARQVLLGDAANLIPAIGQTISENKEKIRLLDIFSKAKNELGLDANLMIVEDFNPTTEIDNFVVDVLSCTSGGRLIGVKSDEGLINGAFYWISDGINQEIVQVDGVSYSTDYYRVSITEALSYDYNSENVKLFRTTYSVGNGVVDKKRLTFSPNSPFKGIEANIERTLTIDFNGAHISDEGLILDNYFTLIQD